MNWSTDGQTPEFLAATRMISLNDSLIETVLSRLQLKPGMRVLDVGCGSGEYSFRLGSATQDVHYTGVEIDPAFVDFANRRAAGEVGYPFEEPSSANEYRFVCGNGLDLPFEDGEFDAVISHTYLTAVPDWACAFAEMCRVCKPGGTVSSITSLTDDFYGTGSISLFTSLLDSETVKLLELVEKAKAKLAKDMDLASGIYPRKVPVSFDWIGLQDVTCAPLPHYFCLSDAAVTDDERKRNIQLLSLMETNQMARLKASRKTARMLTDEQWETYADLIEFRREALLDCSVNREWNWYGNASLLVCGTVPAEPPLERWKSMRDANKEACSALQACVDAGLAKGADTAQLGPGRCVKTVLALKGRAKRTVFGFDPPRALLEACGIVLDNDEARFLRAEASFLDEGADLETLPAFPNADIYRIPDMWETVSEAAMSHVKTMFKDAGTVDDCAVVACITTKGKRTAKAVAAHPDYREAAMRAFARAYGALVK